VITASSPTTRQLTASRTFQQHIGESPLSLASLSIALKMILILLLSGQLCRLASFHRVFANWDSIHQNPSELAFKMDQMVFGAMCLILVKVFPLLSEKIKKMKTNKQTNK